MSKEKVKVYIYTRVSTSMQIDGYSLDAQKSRMKAFCDFNDYEIASEYEDAGKSGKTIEGRVAFNQMIQFTDDGNELNGPLDIIEVDEREFMKAEYIDKYDKSRTFQEIIIEDVIVPVSRELLYQAYGVLWNLSFLLQTFAFWFFNMWSLMTIKNVFLNVLSGSMIPLWFMPEWMMPIMNWLPFSSIYFTPVQIYLGQLTGKEIGMKFLLQLIWIVILYLSGNLVWEKGKKKLVVQGG